MNEKLYEIVCVMDKSGSMSSVVDDSVGGFNEFVRSQQKLAKEKNIDINLSTVLFSDYKQRLFENINIHDVKDLTTDEYVCGGMTALLDALGSTIDDVGKRLSNTREENRPRKVIFCVITDGHENRSTKYTRTQVSDMIKRQEETYNWEFIYLGANQDEFAEGASMGFSHANIYGYQSTNVGTRKAYAYTVTTAVTKAVNNVSSSSGK